MMSVEIVTAAKESTGYPGLNLTVDNVPTVVGALAGITGMVQQSPRKQSTGRTPEAQWAGKDARNQDVTVLLWRDIPFEETYAAEIGPGLVESEE